eukprot:3315883-Pyramimonas_sp.AAC.1
MDLSVKDVDLYRSAQWRTMEDHLFRLSMQWLGHVARMPVWRRPKQALFGWIAGRSSEERSNRMWQYNYLLSGVRKMSIHEIDWFRRAMNRKGWRSALARASPGPENCPEHARALDRWQPGDPLPFLVTQD